jgi:hypothetical protein
MTDFCGGKHIPVFAYMDASQRLFDAYMEASQEIQGYEYGGSES